MPELLLGSPAPLLMKDAASELFSQRTAQLTNNTA